MTTLSGRSDRQLMAKNKLMSIFDESKWTVMSRNTSMASFANNRLRLVAGEVMNICSSTHAAVRIASVAAHSYMTLSICQDRHSHKHERLGIACSNSLRRPSMRDQHHQASEISDEMASFKKHASRAHISTVVAWTTSCERFLSPDLIYLCDFMSRIPRVLAE